MATTWPDVLVIAPELSVVDPSVAGPQFVTMAYNSINPDVWGGMADQGAKYLAAHLATISLRRGQPGSPHVKRVGAVMAGFQVLSDALLTTAYGAEFDRLLLELPAARFAIGGFYP